MLPRNLRFRVTGDHTGLLLSYEGDIVLAVGLGPASWTEGCDMVRRPTDMAEVREHALLRDMIQAVTPVTGTHDAEWGARG